MSTIVPAGEMLRRAVRWISDERVARPDVPLAKLVDEASMRFDLDPAQEEWLLHTFVTGSTKE